MKTDAATSNYRTSLLAYGLAVLALLIGSALTNLRFWGINWYGYFGWYGPALLLVIAVVTPLVLSRKRTWLSQTPPEPGGEDSRFWPIFVALVVVFGAGFILLAARTHFLGDGYLLLGKVESSSPLIKSWERGVHSLLSALYGWFGGAGTDAARSAFRVVSWGSGLLVILACGWAAARLYTDTVRRLLFILTLATGGYALMFFGYVENYPLLILAFVLFALIGLQIARGLVGRWWLLAPLLLAAMTHLFSAVMLPAAVYLLAANSALGDRIGAIDRRFKLAAVVALLLTMVAAGYYLYHAHYFVRFALVPLLQDRFTVEGYTLFSIKHLLDWFNLLFILAPVLPIVAAALLSGRRQKRFQGREYSFLFWLLIPSLLVSFLFDPKLGMPRDWDVFGFVGVPLVVLAVYALLDSRHRIKGYAAVGTLAVVLSALILIPRAVVPVAPDMAIAWFDDIAELDVLKSSTGRFALLTYLEEKGRLDEAERRRDDNSLVYQHQALVVQGRELMLAGQVEQGEAMFRRAVRIAPTYPYGWTSLGMAAIRRDRYDSADVYLQISNGLNPYNPDTHTGLGQVYLFQGDYEEGEYHCREAARLDPENFTARGNLLRLYKKQERMAEFDSVLMEMAWLPDSPLEYVAQSAASYLRHGDYDAAGRAFKRALSMGLDTAVVRRLQQQYPDLKVVD